MTWRTPEQVLDAWRRDHGVSDLRPEDLEPHFARVERFLHASTQDPGSIGRDQALFRAGAETQGWRVIDDVRNQVHCGGCDVCTLGCPTGAKQSVLVTYLPRALSFGARVEADARVEALELRGKRATGVRGSMVSVEGRRIPFRARANAVFVCGGGIQTPALLLRSGVRSPCGAIGRNLSLHPNAKVVGVFDEPVEAWKGVHQAYQVREFLDEGILLAAVNLPPGVAAATLRFTGADLGRVMADYPRMVTAGALVDDESRGRVRALPGGAPWITYRLGERDAAKIVRAVGLLCDLLITAGARTLHLPFDGAPPLTSRNEVRHILDRPVDRRSLELFTVHMMGTAAMGNDPVRHVCDSFGRVNDTEGLYVADASLFPTPIGLNPMETIMALATRNAERFLEARAR